MSGMPPELAALMGRFCQLGRLLPSEADMEIVFDDPPALAEAKVILSEMAKTKSQIDDILLRHGYRACDRCEMGDIVSSSAAAFDGTAIAARANRHAKRR